MCHLSRVISFSVVEKLDSNTLKLASLHWKSYPWLYLLLQMVNWSLYLLLTAVIFTENVLFMESLVITDLSLSLRFLISFSETDSKPLCLCFLVCFVPIIHWNATDISILSDSTIRYIGYLSHFLQQSSLFSFTIFHVWVPSFQFLQNDKKGHS